MFVEEFLIGEKKHKVTIKQVDPCSLHTSFGGQKVLHPMKTGMLTKTVLVYPKGRGKNQKPVEKQVQDPVYTPEFVSAEAEEALTNPMLIGIKFDGACGMVTYDDATGTYTMHTRLDLKFTADNKIQLHGATYDSAADLPPAMVPCEADPRLGSKYENYRKLHWPFMVPIASATAGAANITILDSIPGLDTSKTYKWNIVAFTTAVQSGKLQHFKTNFTCEQMGPQFNLKKTCDLMDKPMLLPHNAVVMELPSELKNFNGLCRVLQEVQIIEGVVIYGHNGTIWKFRRDMLIDSTNPAEKLEWPPKGAAHKPTTWAQDSALA